MWSFVVNPILHYTRYNLVHDHRVKANDIRVHGVVRTVAAPPSIVVKCGGWFFVWSFVVFLSCVVW